MLLSWANVQFYQDLMSRIRSAIEEGTFSAFAADLRRRYDAGN